MRFEAVLYTRAGREVQATTTDSRQDARNLVANHLKSMGARGCQTYTEHVNKRQRKTVWFHNGEIVAEIYTFAMPSVWRGSSGMAHK